VYEILICRDFELQLCYTGIAS